MSDPHWREVQIPGATGTVMQHLCSTTITRQWRSAIFVPGQRAVWRCPGCGAEQSYRPAIVLAKEVQG